MNVLAPADLRRLVKIAGMFGSSHGGERAAAAAHADRIVRDAGLIWPDVLTPKPPASEGLGAQTSWRRELSPAMILATYGPALTGWERCFLAGLVKRPNWTPRQIEVLNDIRARFT